MTNGGMWKVLSGVAYERNRQELLKAQGRFQFTCADDGMTNFERLAVLTEEIGEVAKEALTLPGIRLARDTLGSLSSLREELIQVAAIATAWIEWIDGKPGYADSTSD